MISLIEAKHFRCLRYIRQELNPFQVLVGPNASGKTTFLDVVAFLGDLVSHGLHEALSKRSDNYLDLLWGRSGESFELAIEAVIPEIYRNVIREKQCDRVRYEVGLGLLDGEFSILEENVLFMEAEKNRERPVELFPSHQKPPETILLKRSKKSRVIASKILGGNDNFYSEVYGESGKGWVPAFKLGPRKSTLGNLPADETRFPVAVWLKQLLVESVQQIMLNSLWLRKPSPPGHRRGFKSDGSNLPWLVERLSKDHPESFEDWIAHLRTALPDLETIRTVEREDDKHRYLMLRYHKELEVPSWMASDGTLRMLALTLPAYLPDFSGVYLIEEPENGVHPRAVEAVFQSLSSTYSAQILLASHSPIILNMVKSEDVLCFAKNSEGATDIVSGAQHPALKEWQGETSLGTLFASGVLG